MKWTVRTDLTGKKLTDLHTISFSSVADLYDGQDPRKLETYTQRVNAVLPNFSQAHREALVAGLRPYLREIGASAAAHEQLERLLDSRSVAVVTGQQAGLFGGPMYSVYKALSAVGLAKRLERELARPVVPIFWVASEDHDWGEVDHAYVIDASDEVRRIKLRTHIPDHQMVYHLPLSAESVDAAIRDASQVLPETPDKTAMLQILRDSWQADHSLAMWFASMMARLTSQHGLVLLDPCLPELRKLVAPVWKLALERNAGVGESLQAAYADVSDFGANPEVLRDERNTTLFYVTQGRRYVLERTEADTLRVRSLGIEKTVAEWVAIAEQDPSCFSSNVLLRPVVQDFLLPTLAYVGGSSELAYHPLSRGVFHALGRTLPPLLLRQSVLVYPESVVRHIRKWQVSPAELSQRPDLVTPRLRQLGADDISAVFAAYQADVQRRWNEVNVRFQDLGTQVADLTRAQVDREVAGLQRLERKFLFLFAEQHNVQVRQLRHIERWLWTDGHQQERRLCPIGLWARYGLEWFAQLPVWDDYQNPGAVYHLEMN